jgi:hypothetical protein
MNKKEVNKKEKYYIMPYTPCMSFYSSTKSRILVFGRRYIRHSDWPECILCICHPGASRTTPALSQKGWCKNVTPNKPSSQDLSKVNCCTSRSARWGWSNLLHWSWDLVCSKATDGFIYWSFHQTGIENDRTVMIKKRAHIYSSRLL